jgi:hypothetical protein
MNGLNAASRKSRVVTVAPAMKAKADSVSAISNPRFDSGKSERAWALTYPSIEVLDETLDPNIIPTNGASSPSISDEPCSNPMYELYG